MTRRLLRGLTPILALLALASPAAAQHQQDMVDGDQVERNTKNVMQSIDWKPSMKALRVAASESNKPIFWLQLVGKLDDGL